MSEQTTFSNRSIRFFRQHRFLIVAALLVGGSVAAYAGGCGVSCPAHYQWLPTLGICYPC